MRGQAPRAETCTVVAIAPASTIEEVCATLETLARTSGVRPVLITLGGQREPTRSTRNGTIVIEGLVARYLNNAVASLRLSSLPALAWWRAESTSGLPELTDLVDRVVLDVADPSSLWRRVPELSGRHGISDLRWARLTRWRDLFAQFFDLPDVRQAAGALTRLEIGAGDAHAARLLAGWITTRLPGGDRLAVSIIADGAAAIQSLRLTSETMSLALRLLPSGSCIESEVIEARVPPSVRVVSVGDQGLAALLGEELRVRSRDLAFEDAAAAAGGMQ